MVLGDAVRIAQLDAPPVGQPQPAVEGSVQLDDTRRWRLSVVQRRDRDTPCSLYLSQMTATRHICFFLVVRRRALHTTRRLDGRPRVDEAARDYDTAVHYMT